MQIHKSTSLKSLALRCGAVFALSAGLVACNNTQATPTTPVSTTKAALTIKFSGSNKTAVFRVARPDGSVVGDFNMKSGAIMPLDKGTYIVSVVGSAVAAQTVTLTSDQEINFAL